MDQIIKVVNQLQDIFAGLKITCPFNLPQIAVVGEQSSGKSSVLEAFVGRDFLPRGSGIVTRRPLVLQLINQNGPEYATFLHTNNKFTDFLEVRNEINRETDRVTGKNKNISPLPINLRIYSPNVANLTLIDLPGITKVAVADQPPDIEMQIKSMILSYIENTNCLILAVIPAVNDLANSEALAIARQVDPQRIRTIGVITKIDMMDVGTDCLETLSNKTYPLSRGFVGIVNRNQRDIESKKDIFSAQEDEKKFFQNHPIYHHLGDSVGSRYLQTTLSQQLTAHIKQTLPELKQSVSDELNKLQSIIDMNPELYNDTNDPSQIYKSLMLKVRKFRQKVECELGYINEQVELDNLSCGAKLASIMFHKFMAEIQKTKPIRRELKKQIRFAILNSQGMSEGIFSAGGPFLAVIRQYISKMEIPCLHIVELVRCEICKMVEKAGEDAFSHYPQLFSEIIGFIDKEIDVGTREAISFLKLFIDMNIEHINTYHPDFLTSKDPSGYQEKGQGDQRRMVTAIENVIHKQGPLILSISGIMKGNRECFGVIQGQMIILYKDSLKKEVIQQALLAECRVKSSLSKSKKGSLSIFRKDGQNVIKNNKTLDFVFKNVDDLDSWKGAFVCAGLEVDKNEDLESEQSDFEDTYDQEMVKQTNYVHLLVESYLEITIKTLQDVLSKVCVKNIIYHLRENIMSDLIGYLYSISHINELFMKSEQACAERDNTLKLYNSCKDAIQIINSFISAYDIKTPLIPGPKYTPSCLPQTTTKIEPRRQSPQPSTLIFLNERSKSPNNASSMISTSQSQPDLAKPNSTIRKKPKRPPPKEIETKFYL